MEVDGKVLKEHIEGQTGTAFIESASGWKGPCPFEPKSTADSFLIFNSPEGEFYCFSCKAKGGIEAFDLRWGELQSKKRNLEIQERLRKKQLQDELSARQPRPVAEKRARAEAAAQQTQPEPIYSASGEEMTEPAVFPQQSAPAGAPLPPVTARGATAALVETLRGQLDYLQRQNEGLHGLVLKYNNMLTGSRQLLLESKELLLDDNEEKQKLAVEVRLQQSKITELERQLDRWRVIKSELESFVETLESFTRRLRSEFFR